MRSLPDTSLLPHSLSMHSQLSSVGKTSTATNTTATNGLGNGHHNGSSVITPSVRHLSESMANIHLSNVLATPSPPPVAAAAAAAVITPTTTAAVSSLAHHTSLASLTPKALETTNNNNTVVTTPSTFPSIATTTTSAQQQQHHTAPPPPPTATLAPLGTPTATATAVVAPVKKPVASVAANNTSVTPASNKSCVVRPLMSRTATAKATATATNYNNHHHHQPHQHLKALDNIKVSSLGGGHGDQHGATSIIPDTRNHPAGLDFNDFLPKHIQQYGYDATPFLTEIEAIDIITKGHKATVAGLDYRRKQVQIVLAMWATKQPGIALEYAVNLDEKSIIIDILNVMNFKP